MILANRKNSLRRVQFRHSLIILLGIRLALPACRSSRRSLLSEFFFKDDIEGHFYHGFLTQISDRGEMIGNFIGNEVVLGRT